MGLFSWIIFISACLLQYIQHLEACPLCMLQRWIFLILGLLGMVAFYHVSRAQPPKPYLMGRYRLSLLFFTLIGFTLAGRQIWLQHLPADQIPACGPSLAVLLEYFPLYDALKIALIGSGQCAKVDWRFLSLSLAEWSFVSLSLVFLIGLIPTPSSRIHSPITPHR
jgi:disulfide bond formation protein DsbB